MLEGLKQYTNLGSAGYYWELINLFYDRPGVIWDDNHISDHFYNKIIEGESIFDGCIPFLLSTHVLSQNQDGSYSLAYKFKYRLQSREHCKQKILEALILAISKDPDTYSIFCPEFCTFDLINNVIQINVSAFGLKYANIRKLMINLGFLLPHPNYPNRAYIVSKRYKSLFDKYITQDMRKRFVPPDELKSILAKQQENGLKAEAYVISYETSRLNNKEGVEWIANYDSAAGFDIMSFETTKSKAHDRFIEVKAYSGKVPYFFWSKNEIDTARNKRSQYCLYLVNLDKIANPTYLPLIISDPYSSVLGNDDWIKTVDKYHIKQAH